jgi:hypothetical protein
MSWARFEQHCYIMSATVAQIYLQRSTSHSSNVRIIVFAVTLANLVQKMVQFGFRLPVFRIACSAFFQRLEYLQSIPVINIAIIQDIGALRGPGWERTILFTTRTEFVAV